MGRVTGILLIFLMLSFYSIKKITFFCNYVKASETLLTLYCKVLLNEKRAGLYPGYNRDTFHDGALNKIYFPLRPFRNIGRDLRPGGSICGLQVILCTKWHCAVQYYRQAGNVR